MIQKGIVLLMLIASFAGCSGCEGNGQVSNNENNNNDMGHVKDAANNNKKDALNNVEKDVDDPTVPNVIVVEGSALTVVPTDFNSDGKLDVEIHIDTKTKSLGALNLFFDFDNSKVSIDETRGLDITKDSGKGFHYGVATSKYISMSNSGDNANGHFRLATIGAFANNDDYANGNSAHVATVHLQKQAAFDSGDVAINIRINEKADDLGKAIQ